MVERSARSPLPGKTPLFEFCSPLREKLNVMNPRYSQTGLPHQMSSGGFPVPRKFLISLCSIRAAPDFRRSFTHTCTFDGWRPAQNNIGDRGCTKLGTRDAFMFSTRRRKYIYMAYLEQYIHRMVQVVEVARRQNHDGKCPARM